MSNDLIQVLRDIEAEAKRARQRLAAGAAINGVTSLLRIEHEASDALARVEEEATAVGGGAHTELDSFQRKGGEAPASAGDMQPAPSSVLARAGSAALGVDGRHPQSSDLPPHETFESYVERKRDENGAAALAGPAPRPKGGTP